MSLSMDPASPTKRRALAPLNANAASPVARKTDKTMMQHAKPLPAPQVASKSPSRSSTPSPSPATAREQRKRSVDEVLEEGQDEGTPAKKLCPEQPSRQPSPVSLVQSPTARRVLADAIRVDYDSQSDGHPSSSLSSVFDTRTGASQETSLGEPEITGNAPQASSPKQSNHMTREETRRKAEILRLRLSLANYKVRTGQTDVPLSKLQRRPLIMAINAAGRTTAKVNHKQGFRNITDGREGLLGRAEMWSRHNDQRRQSWSSWTGQAFRDVVSELVIPSSQDSMREEEDSAVGGLLSLSQGRQS